MRLLLNLAHEKDFNLICIQNEVKKCIFSATSFYFIICILDCVIVGIVLVEVKAQAIRELEYDFYALTLIISY